MTLPATQIVWVLALTAAVAGCKEPTPERKQTASPVKLEAAHAQLLRNEVSLTGVIAARVEANLSFRTGGRITERLVDVDDGVKKGQLLARIAAEVQDADLSSAHASLTAAEANLSHAEIAYRRQAKLLRKNITSRSNYEAAEEGLEVARSSLEVARATLSNVEEARAYTELRAEADGIITARRADVGETVGAAQTVFSIALNGPRDAVFDVYEALLLEGTAPPEVTVSLVSNPAVVAKGRVRQIAPSVDQATGTVRVKVSLEPASETMSLGAPVVGRAFTDGEPVIVLPPAALASALGKPAVWVFQTKNQTVHLQAVDLASFQTNALIVSGGLREGEQVVVEGTKLLREGQTVIPADEATQ
ncbi:MAG: mdtA 1 [Rhizobium sp.]|nr:mdtA 1 [Rhizobium sp.]